VIIHSRKAEEDAIEILEEEGFVSFSCGSGSRPNVASGDAHPTLRESENKIRTASGNNKKHPAVIMHCFNGKKGLVKRARDNGWFFSIPPVITRLHHFRN